MDTLTHALSGALLARATWHKRHQLSLRHRTQIGFLTAAFPDIDYLLRLTTDNFLVYLNYHRGVTHSILLLPMWAFLLAFLFSKFFRDKPDWRSLYVICCLGLGIHIIGDVITSYGTMILSPLSDWRASLDTTFIIDPYFTGIIIAALLGSTLRANQRLIASTGMLALIGYIGLQAWAQHSAVEFAERSSRANGWDEAVITALPQPLSPFNWKLIIEHQQHYHIGLLRLFDNRPELETGAGYLAQISSAYYPADEIIWTREYRYGNNTYQSQQIEQAWQNETISDFRRFARYPFYVDHQFAIDDARSACHWFADLRFILPVKRERPFFTFGLCPPGQSGNSELKRLD